MSRFAVGPRLLAEPVEVGTVPWADNLRPLMPGERTPEPRDTYVPEQLSTADGAVAAWVATGETLRDAGLAFAVVRRAPDVDSFPIRGAPFDVDTARAVVRDLRSGKTVATALVVRLACQMMERV